VSSLELDCYFASGRSEACKEKVFRILESCGFGVFLSVVSEIGVCVIVLPLDFFHSVSH
jgi:hypothetical protein